MMTFYFTDTPALQISNLSTRATVEGLDSTDCCIAFATSKTMDTVNIRRQLDRLNAESINPLLDLGQFEERGLANNPITASDNAKRPLLVLVHSYSQAIIVHKEVKVASVSNRIKSCDAVQCSHVGFQRQLAQSDSSKTNLTPIEDTYSLGRLRHDTAIVEPLMRDTEALHIYLDVVRKSDINEPQSIPTGLFAEELCQIARYAGESSSLKVIEIISSTDCPKDAMLIAELLWYISEGRSYRVEENPLTNTDNFSTYIVNVDGTEQTLDFYRHTFTNKWWVKGLDNNSLIACSHLEYTNAVKGDISNRILKLL